MKPTTTVLFNFIAGIIGAALVVSGSIPIPRVSNGETPNTTDKTNSATTSEDVKSDHEALIVKTVESASPAVVSIVISKDVPVVEQFFEEVPGSPFGSFFDPFGQFNFQVPRLRQNGTERQEIGGGTGFLISTDGMIVTNRHVVEDTSAEYTVFLQNGDKFTATVLARDPVNDIAVLKISTDNLPFLAFGNSEQLHPGQTVIAIGNALSEFRNSVSVGVISGLLRSITAGNGRGETEQLEEVIQTDAAINPGNSGGPLLNSSGKVIGVNVAVALGSENIGFALPANVVADIVSDVREHGRIIRPFLGVRYAPITPLIKERYKLTSEQGVLIISGETPTDVAVIPGSPAALAGLKEGDIIVSIDGNALTEDTSLATAIADHEVGDTITLQVITAGQERTVQVTLQEAP